MLWWLRSADESWVKVSTRLTNAKENNSNSPYFHAGLKDQGPLPNSFCYIKNWGGDFKVWFNQIKLFGKEVGRMPCKIVNDWKCCVNYCLVLGLPWSARWDKELRSDHKSFLSWLCTRVELGNKTSYQAADLCLIRSYIFKFSLRTSYLTVDLWVLLLYFPSLFRSARGRIWIDFIRRHLLL